MKKSILLFLMISLLWVPGVLAAGVPVKGPERVQDEAGLLSRQDAETLSKIAGKEPLTFYVLTVDSTKGRSADAYANDVYDSWKLNVRDVLLFISAKEHDVQLVFQNAELQQALDTWSQQQGHSSGSAALTALLDAYFVPAAKSGNMAGGIRKVMEAARTLITSPAGSAGSSETGAAGSGSSGVGTTETAGSGVGQSSGASGTPGTGSRSETVAGSSHRVSPVVIAGSVAGAVLIIGALIVLVTGLRRRKQLANQQEQLSALLVRTNHALESLKPFQGLVQGKTGALVEEIYKRMSAQLVDISARTGEFALPAFYQLAALRKTIEQLQQVNGAFLNTVETDEKQIAAIQEADRHVKERITALKKEIPELAEALQSAVRETGYPLGTLGQDFEILQDRAAKADQHELFDPIAAQEFAEDARKRQIQTQQDLADLGTYNAKLHAFSGVLADTRDRIAGLIQQHSLHNMKVRPYDQLELAKAEAEAMKAPLQEGHMEEVRSIASRIDLLLSEAVAMTERQGQIRAQNRQDLETVRANWSRLKQQRDDLEGGIRTAAGRFAAQYLADARHTLEESGTRLKEGAGEVPQIETWTSDERGEFDQARGALDRLLAMQDETSSRLRDAAQSLDALENRLTSVRRLLSEGSGRVDSALHMLQRNGLSSRAGLAASLRSDFAKLEQRLAAPPYQLDELETLARSYETGISAFASEVNRLIREKEERERQAAMALMMEQQRREQAQHNSHSSTAGTGGHNHSSGGSSWDGGSDRSSGGSKW